MAGVGVVNQRGGAKISRPIVVGEGGNFFSSILFWRGDFFNTLFLLTFFQESDITCIITVVGAQQQHKGMFILNMGEGQIFPTVTLGEGGGGAIFFQCILEGGGALFFA